MSSRSGIYSITHESARRYIGSAVNLACRWRHHRRLLRNGIHNNVHLQRAWNLYGEEAFRFEVLEECEIRQLIEREQWWMDVAQPEYNICKVAGSKLGCRHTEETKEKLSAYARTPEGRERNVHSGRVTMAKMPEIHSLGGYASAARMTPEQRRERARIANAQITPEQRRENGRKASREDKSRAGRLGNCSRHHFDRSKIDRLCAECAAKQSR